MRLSLSLLLVLWFLIMLVSFCISCQVRFMFVFPVFSPFLSHMSSHLSYVCLSLAPGSSSHVFVLVSVFVNSCFILIVSHPASSSVLLPVSLYSVMSPTCWPSSPEPVCIYVLSFPWFLVVSFTQAFPPCLTSWFSSYSNKAAALSLAFCPAPAGLDNIKRTNWEQYCFRKRIT